MFVFQISNYDNPELDMEVAKLFQQRLEAHSRCVVPSMWKLIDKLNAYAAKGPGREVRRVRYHIYGVVLFVAGVFVLLTGMMEPRTPPLIFSGLFAIICGILEFLLVRKKKPPRIPASCQSEAKELLSKLRTVDWSEAVAEIRFSESGMASFEGDSGEIVPYENMTAVFETENLWLLTFIEGKTILLQKRDLILGNADEFSLYLRQNAPSID